jgi:hypothetical protein
MSTYHYDQVYPYEKILQEVKELILPTIEEMANPEDLINTGISKSAYADIIYTHIMALGYNAGDLRAAFDDIFPARNMIMYPETDEQDAAGKMIINLAAISKDFKHQFWAFQDFHKNTTNLMPYKQVIIEVKKRLLATQFGF